MELNKAPVFEMVSLTYPHTLLRTDVRMGCLYRYLFRTALNHLRLPLAYLRHAERSPLDLLERVPPVPGAIIGPHEADRTGLHPCDIGSRFVPVGDRILVWDLAIGLRIVRAVPVLPGQ